MQIDLFVAIYLFSQFSRNQQTRKRFCRDFLSAPLSILLDYDLSLYFAHALTCPRREDNENEESRLPICHQSILVDKRVAAYSLRSRQFASSLVMILFLFLLISEAFAQLMDPEVNMTAVSFFYLRNI